MQVTGIKGLVCFDCHNPLTTTDRAINFSHEKHAERGAHCTVCHGQYDHQSPPADAQPHEYGIGGTCLDCHDGQKAPGDCMLCHRDRHILMPATHRREGFLREHGPVNDPATDCHLCHAASWCLGCHQVEVPHASGFMGRHGSEFSKNPKICYQCHEPQGCHDCHGVPVPHDRTFIGKHGLYEYTETHVAYIQHG